MGNSLVSLKPTLGFTSLDDLDHTNNYGSNNGADGAKDTENVSDGTGTFG